jgi:Na+/melibiose symporter-like transporter
VPWDVKLGYAMGQGGESVKNWGFGTLLILYYNQVLGVPGTLIGIGMFIAVLSDAIADPAVGSWSDGFQSRWGRRHIPMALSILPTGILFFLLFWPPSGLDEWQLVLWFTILCVALRTSLTFFQVPYLSLGAELTHSYVERTRIVALRLWVGMVASLFVVFVAWTFFFVKTEAEPTPQLAREPYFGFAVASAIVMCVLMAVAVVSTLRAIPHLAGAHQAPRRFSLKRVYAEIVEALRSQSFRALWVGTLIFFIYSGTHGALATHLKTYFWQLDPRGIQYWQYGGIVGALVGIPLAPTFTRVFDKKWTVVIAVVAACLAGTLPVLFGVFGWMPEDTEVLLWTLVVLAFVGACLGIQSSVAVGSMMGDIADEHELRHGTRQEGIYFGTYSFSGKCTTAVGNLIAGGVVDVIGLPPGAKPGEVAPEVLTNFGLAYLFIALLLVVSIWVFLPYSLDSKRHGAIVEQLRSRRNASAGAVSPRA